MLLLSVLIGVAASSYPALRPIPNGNINQGYKWGEEFTNPNNPNQIFSHKGIDFVAATGTNVYAVADGKVVDLEETRPDENHSTLWGNYVLILHDQKHWDDFEGASVYVYSMYLHLKGDSVLVNVGDTITAGQWIAKSDNTGQSFGSHLHLQIVLHPQNDRTIENLQSNTRSRNPELWLEPLSGTGTAIGRVSDSQGSPIPNLVICGIKKASSLSYVSSRTYSFDWANPDDILHENFGTTDVKPGTYSLYANPLADGCAGPYDYSLGSYTFSAKRATYIGLYPSWSPVVRPVASGWNTDFFIRNHATNQVSVSYSTFGDEDSLTHGQRVRTIPANGMAIVGDEPDTSDTAISVPNEDASVVVMFSKNDGHQPAGYTNIMAAGGSGTSGWETAGPTVYVPLFKKNWYGRSSRIYVTNTGVLPTTISLTYYNEAGTPNSGGSAPLVPNGREMFLPSSGLTSGVYSAVITSTDSQPLAVIVFEGTVSITHPYLPAAYNGFSDGAYNLYGPLIKKNYLGQTTGITIQNIGNTTTDFTANYYDMNGDLEGTVSGTALPLAPYVIYNPIQIDDGFVGSVHIWSNGQKLVGQMSEADTGSLRLMSNLAFKGTSTIYLPIWYDDYTATGENWISGVNVRNTGSGENRIAATLYSQAGVPIFTQIATLDDTNDTHNFYNLLSGSFIGSMVIQSTSNKSIVAVSNIRNWNGESGKDAVMAINGSNR